jgi:hypothetical protein
MKNYNNVVMFLLSHANKLFTITALLIGLLGDAPPGC